MVFIESTNEKRKPPKAPLFHPLQRRFHIVLFLMVGFCCTTFMRSSLAMTITCMVNSTAVAMNEEHDYGVKEEIATNINESLTEGPTCSREQRDGHQIVVDYGGSLVWDHKIQNLMFSGTFWGALLTVLPSGFILQRGSPRIIFMGAVAIYSISSLAVPFLANTLGYKSVFASRVMMGFGEGFVMPTINALVSNWFPITERSTAIALYTTGNQLAAAGGNPLAAALCSSSWGWEAVFYLSGTVGFTWILLWFLTSANQPSKCKLMTDRERKYLEDGCVTRSNKNNKSQNIPYKAILSSPPFLAQVLCQLIISMIAVILQLYLPTYFKDVLLLGVVTNGFFTSLPSICNFIFKLLWSIVMDKLKEKKILTPTQTVRISQGISSFGQAATFIALALFVDCSTPLLALSLVIVNSICMGCSTSGFFTSLLSLAPRYTPTLSAISMFIAMIGRLVAPFMVGLLKKTGTVAEWKSIFLWSGGLMLLAGAAFVTFGSGDVQEWGVEDSELFSSDQKREKLILVDRTKHEMTIIQPDYSSSDEK